MTDAMPEQTVDLDAVLGEEPVGPAPVSQLDAVHEHSSPGDWAGP